MKRYSPHKYVILFLALISIVSIYFLAFPNIDVEKKLLFSFYTFTSGALWEPFSCLFIIGEPVQFILQLLLLYYFGNTIFHERKIWGVILFTLFCHIVFIIAWSLFFKVSYGALGVIFGWMAFHFCIYKNQEISFLGFLKLKVWIAIFFVTLGWGVFLKLGIIPCVISFLFGFIYVQCFWKKSHKIDSSHT